MNKEIENIIKKNLPEKKKGYFPEHDETDHYLQGFNQALSSIDTSLIADEVLKVMVEKIKDIFITEIRSSGDMKPYNPSLRNKLPLFPDNNDYVRGFNTGLKTLLSNLSPNKENEK